MVDHEYTPLNLSSESYQLLPDTDSRDGDLESEGGGLDILQFSEAIGVVETDEGYIEVEIMRIGDYKGTISCHYETHDGSAKAGHQYVHCEGDIVMKEGQRLANIKVLIINDPDWSASKEFKVALTKPKGCEIGRYLSTTRVRILDEDPFPSHREPFEEAAQLGEAGIEALSPWYLFFGLCELLSHQEGVMRRTFIAVTIGVLKNLNEYMHLTLSVYMVNTIFNFKTEGEGLLVPGNRLNTAYVVAGLLFFPKLLFFFLDHADVSMDIGGLLRAELSKSVYRHFMSYGIESRNQVPTSDMVESLTQDVGEVTFGYMRTLSAVRLLGQIGIGIFFTLQHNPSVWWTILVVPAIMLLWARVRTKVSIEAAEKSGESMAHITGFIHETMSKIDLILSYKMNQEVNDLFSEKVAEFKDVRIPEKRVNVNNNVVPKLMGPALVDGYIAYGAAHVLNHTLPLGTYLATIRAFGNICSDFEELYGLVMEIIGTFPALKGLTMLMNKETDLRLLNIANDTRKQVTHERTAAIEKRTPSTREEPSVDELEIEMNNATYLAPLVQNVVFENLSFRCRQGTIVAVLAQSGCGRRTLLDMMCGNIFPSSGTLYIPSHLRTLLVSGEVMYFSELTVWENLTFGCGTTCDPKRVEKILRFFDINIGRGTPYMSDVLALIKDEMEGRKSELEIARGNTSDWEDEKPLHAHEDESRESGKDHRNPMDAMTASKRALIHLCRGFIYNPEVLLVHRPFSHFQDHSILEKLEQALQEYRDNRGLRMPSHRVGTRRPRTAIITPEIRIEALERLADMIWYLPDKPGEPCLMHDLNSDHEMGDAIARKISNVTRKKTLDRSGRRQGTRRMGDSSFPLKAVSNATPPHSTRADGKRREKQTCSQADVMKRLIGCEESLQKALLLEERRLQNDLIKTTKKLGEIRGVGKVLRHIKDNGDTSHIHDLLAALSSG